MYLTRFFALIFCVAPLFLEAQQSTVLDQYIEQGLRSNLALQQQELDLKNSLLAIEQARSLFKPQVDFTANYTGALGGRRIDFPIGDLLNPVYSTLNQLTGGNNFPLLENQQIQFLPNNFQETKFRYAIPLYNTDLRYNRLIQEQLYQSQMARKAALSNEIRYEITKAYLQYLQVLEAEKIWQNTRNVLLELRRFNESLVNNNVATKDIVASADYELSKADAEIIGLQSQQNTARAYFNFLLNEELQAPVTVDSLLLKSAFIPLPSLDSLLALAPEQRSEMMALAAGISAAELNVKRIEANLRKPDFYLGGEAGSQGFVGTNFRDQLFILAQVGLTYEVFDGGQRKKEAQQARIAADQLRLRREMTGDQIELQITQARNEWEAAQRKHQAAQSGLIAAESALRIVNNKYRAGQVLLLEYMNAQNRATISRLTVLLAWADVLQKSALVKRAASMQ
jgi:outer membrane protein